MKTIAKANIDEVRYNNIADALPEEKKQIFRDAIEAMNELVNHIEHSGRIATTQHHYGSYLPLIKTKQDFVLYRIAGAGQGACSAARINLGIGL